MTSIVLVDDEKDLLESLARVLRKEFPNAGVRCTTRPVEAKEWLLAERPTLFITDVRMPEISGLELLSFVSERWGFVPTIIMTAFASPELDEALKLGTFHYLPKPFRNLELVRLVRRLLDEEAAKDEPQGFAGTISVSMLADVVQLHSLAGSSGVLVIDTPHRKGKIFFTKGRIVHAEDGSFEGREAFNQIIGWKGGRFSFARQQVDRETIHAPASELLIDALRISDESQRDDDLLFDIEQEEHSALDLLFSEPVEKPTEASSFEAFGKALDATSYVPKAASITSSPFSAPPSNHSASPATTSPAASNTAPPPTVTKLASVSSSGSLEIVRSHEPAMRPSDELFPPKGYVSSSAIPVNNFLESLRQLEDLGGFLWGAVCDGAQQLLLASYGEGCPPQDVLLAQFEAIQRKLRLLKELQIDDSLQDIVVSSESHFYVLRSCRENNHIFLALLLERDKSNLALARITLQEIEGQLVLSG